MNRRFGFGLLIFFAICILGTAATQAAPIVVYTDRAAFIAATTTTTNITFEGLAPVGGFTTYNTPSGLTVSGVNFVGSTFEEGLATNRLLVFNRPGDPLYDFNSGAVLAGPLTTMPAFFSGITATLPSGVTAVGSDVMTAFDPLGQTVIVTLADGMQETFAATTFLRPERGFIGFSSSVPILSVRFRSNLNVMIGVGPPPLVDNFIFGQASPAAIPEPATIMLLSVGIAGVAAHVRRC